jgi:hypothetical protein
MFNTPRKTLGSLVEVLAYITMNPFVERLISQELISSSGINHLLRYSMGLDKPRCNLTTWKFMPHIIGRSPNLVLLQNIKAE